MPRDIIVTGDGYCVTGMKSFCKKHGIDWKDFVLNGIERSELEKFDDLMVKQALAEYDGRQGR